MCRKLTGKCSGNDTWEEGDGGREELSCSEAGIRSWDDSSELSCTEARGLGLCISLSHDMWLKGIQPLVRQLLLAIGKLSPAISSIYPKNVGFFKHLKINHCDSIHYRIWEEIM